MSKREKYEKLLNNVNVVAALHMINQVESNYGSDSYGVIFGGSTPPLGTDHPRISVPMNDGTGRTSNAAGRYQFMSFTWDEVNQNIGPLDFSNPRHQDIAAIERIEVRGVLDAVIKGDIEFALTGGHPASMGVDACYLYPSGMACEWAGLAPSRYGQGDATIAQNIADFEKFKGVPLPKGGGTPTDTSSNVPTTPGDGNQTAMQAFSASVKYGASSIVGFLGDTKRGILCHQIRLCKVEAGNPPTSVMKVMGGEGNLTGFTPGMNSTATNANANANSGGALKAGEFTPRPGAYISSAPGVPVNSPFGMRGGRMHNGVDQAAPEGTPLLASGDGTVTVTGYEPGYGNHVFIKHSDGLTTTYNHILDGGTKVKAGQKVKQGDVIALMGTTGRSSGPHIHFEFWRGDPDAGTPIDPQTIIPDL